MALNEALKKKRQQENESTINRHPEIDEKIDRFISENLEVYAKINGYSHEDLVRKRILDIVNQNERRQGYREEMREYVEQNPDIKHEVDRRMKRVPEAQREGAFVRIAKNVVASLGMRQPTSQQPY